MKTQDSIRKSAEEEIRSSFHESGFSVNSGDLDDRMPTSIRISTTKEEFIAYLFEKAYLRPNFLLNEHQLEIPVFFAKADKNSESFISDVRERYRLNPNKYVMLSGFHILKRCSVNLNTIEDGIIDDEGIINTALSNQIDEISKLKPKKRFHFFDAVAQIVRNKSSYPELENISAKELFAYCVFDNNNILRAFNESHYDDIPPKVIVIDTNKSTLNACAVCRLLLAHYLCFDIVVASYKNYSSIENYFPEDSYDVHYFEGKKKDFELSKEKKSLLIPALWVVFGLFIIYVVLHWGLKLF